MKFYSMRVWVLLSFAFIPFQSFAENSLESDTSIGSANFIEQVTYTGNENRDKAQSKWNWLLQYTYSPQNTPSTATTAEITDVTSEFVGGAGYGGDTWGGGFGLTYATTPAEYLKD